MIKEFFGSRVVGLCIVSLFISLVSLFVTTGNVEASTFGGSFDYGGLSASFNTGEDPNTDASWVSLVVTSSQFRIDNSYSSFFTFQDDPSEAFGALTISGTKVSDLNQNPLSSFMSLSLGGVSMSNSSSMYSYDYENITTNVGVSDFWIKPFDMRYAQMSYNEWTYESDSAESGYQSSITGFSFQVTFRGSFGDGLEGDLRGLPFAQSVPTPGMMTFVGLATLAFVRRTKKPS